MKSTRFARYFRSSLLHGHCLGRRSWFHPAALAALCSCAGAADLDVEPAPELGSASQALTILEPDTFQLRYRLNLQVDRIEPRVPVENRPMHIYFTVENNSAETKSGWVGAEVVGSGHGLASSATLDDWRIDQLQPGEAARGVLTLPATSAGSGRNATLYFYEQRVPVAEFDAPGPRLVEAAKAFDTSARFRFSLDSFDVNSTRGPDAGAWLGDRVWLSLDAELGGVPFFSEAFYGGRARSGTILPVGKATPPLELVPGISPDVRLGFAAAALPEPGKDEALTALNIISGIGAAVTNAALPEYGVLTAGVHTAHVQINTGLTAQCDGVVAAAAVVWSSGQLDALTTDQDRFSLEAAHPGTSSPAACGGVSLYHSHVSAERLREPTDTIGVSPQVARIQANQTAKFELDIPLEFARFTVEGGAANGLVDYSTGTFIPTSTLRSDGFVTITISDDRDESLRKLPAKAFVTLAPAIPSTASSVSNPAREAAPADDVVEGLSPSAFTLSDGSDGFLTPACSLGAPGLAGRTGLLSSGPLLLGAALLRRRLRHATKPKA